MELDRIRSLLGKLSEDHNSSHRQDRLHSAARRQWQQEMLSRAGDYVDAFQYLSQELRGCCVSMAPPEGTPTLEALHKAMVQQVRTATEDTTPLTDTGGASGAQVVAFAEEAYVRLIQQVKGLGGNAPVVAAPSMSSTALHALCVQHARGLSEVPSAAALERVRELRESSQRRLSGLPRDRQRAAMEAATQAGLAASLLVVRRHLQARVERPADDSTDVKRRIDTLEAERRQKLSLLCALLDTSERRNQLARRWRDTARLVAGVPTAETIPVVVANCKALAGYVPRVIAALEGAAFPIVAEVVVAAKPPRRSIGRVEPPQYPPPPRTLGGIKKGPTKSCEGVVDRLSGIERRAERTVEELKECVEAREVWHHQPAQYVVVDPVHGSGAEAAARYTNAAQLRV